MPKTKQTNADKAASGSGATAQTGYTFVSNFRQPYETSKDVSAGDVFEAMENLYVLGPIKQMANLILSGNITVSVYDDKDDVVEDVSRKLNRMFHAPGCNLTTMSRAALLDAIVWGTSVWNQVWEKDGNELVCKELNHLHSFTFSQQPTGNGDQQSKVYGRLLKGIYYDQTDRTMHYFQMQKTGTSELSKENLFVITDPSSRNPDGDSLVVPVIPIAQLINYAYNALGQQMFRSAAPLMFIRISNPRPDTMVNGELIEGDVSYAEQLLKHWGKDTGFQVRDNMEVHTIDVKEGSLAKVAIQLMSDAIQGYISPVGMLGKDGALISGNSDASLKIVNNYIQGWVSMLSSILRELPNYYLKHNGYPEEWHAEVTIPTITLEDSARKLSEAQLLASTQAGSVNEVRERLGLEGISTEEMDVIKDEWARVSKTAAAGMFGFTSHPEKIDNFSKRENEIIDETEQAVDKLNKNVNRAIKRILRISGE